MGRGGCGGVSFKRLRQTLQNRPKRKRTYGANVETQPQMASLIEEYNQLEQWAKIVEGELGGLEQKLREFFKDFDKWFDKLPIPLQDAEFDRGMKLRQKIIELLEGGSQK